MNKRAQQADSPWAMMLSWQHSYELIYSHSLGDNCDSILVVGTQTHRGASVDPIYYHIAYMAELIIRAG